MYKHYEFDCSDYDSQYDSETESCCDYESDYSSDYSVEEDDLMSILENQERYVNDIEVYSPPIVTMASKKSGCTTTNEFQNKWKKHYNEKFQEWNNNFKKQNELINELIKKSYKMSDCIDNICEDVFTTKDDDEFIVVVEKVRKTGKLNKQNKVKYDPEQVKKQRNIRRKEKKQISKQEEEKRKHVFETENTPIKKVEILCVDDFVNITDDENEEDEETLNINISSVEYETSSEETKKKRKRNRKRKEKKIIPVNNSIKVDVSKLPKIVCNFNKWNQQCPYGDKCRYTHPNPIFKSKKICRNGKNCKFGSRCRFTHL